MAKLNRYEVTLESPDGGHIRVVACQAASEDDARYIAERQEEAFIAAESGADDLVSARLYVAQHRYTVVSVVEG